MTIFAIVGQKVRFDQYCRWYKNLMSLNFCMPPLRFFYSYQSILCFFKEAVLRWFYASRSILCLFKEILLRLFYTYRFILCLSKEVLFHYSYASRFISRSVVVMIIILFYACLSKYCPVTLTLPHGVIFSTKLLQYIVMASIRICYANFIISMEA